MKTWSVLIARGPETDLELAVALSGLLPVRGILEENGSIALYLDEGEDIDDIISWFRDREGTASLEFETTTVEEQNWNAEFEASLRPVEITESVVVAQSWNRHEVEPGEKQILVTIDPKMSFGTGHHETTRLVVQLMEGLDLRGKRVLDAGTGTGILSIIAALKGASGVVAFDNNEWAEQNTRENVELNEVADRVEIFRGDMDDLGPGTFDLIVANIQTFVILPWLPSFAARLNGPNARLITSGILIEDLPDLHKATQLAGLEPVTEVRENEWSGSLMKRI
jgi:ribosomal protein L11 methyltransferase